MVFLSLCPFCDCYDDIWIVRLVVDLMANKGIGKRSVYTNITSKIVYPTQHGRCVDRKYRIQYVRASVL